MATPGNRPLHGVHNIRHYPTIHYFAKGNSKGEPYTGALNSHAMTTWVKKKIAQKSARDVPAEIAVGIDVPNASA